MHHKSHCVATIGVVACTFVGCSNDPPGISATNPTTPTSVSGVADASTSLTSDTETTTTDEPSDSMSGDTPGDDSLTTTISMEDPPDDPPDDLPADPPVDMGSTHEPEMCAGEDLQPDMVCVPGGAYAQGCAEDCPARPGWFPGTAEIFLPYDPDHDVPEFQIHITEVTVASYSDCVDAGDCLDVTPAFCDNGVGNWPYDATTADHPANCVRTVDAAEYCAWLGEERGIPMRLPTECEWEKAARGPEDARPYVAGDAPPGCADARIGANVCDTIGTAEVGSYPNDVSFYGVLDMMGNVTEHTLSRAEGNQGDWAVRGANYSGPSPAGLPFDTRIDLRYPIADDGNLGYGAATMGFRCVAGPSVDEAFDACPAQ